MAWQPVSFTPNQPWNQNAEFLVNAPPTPATPEIPPGISPEIISDLLMNLGVGSGGPGGWQEAVDSGLLNPNQVGPFDPTEALNFLVSPIGSSVANLFGFEMPSIFGRNQTPGFPRGWTGPTSSNELIGTPPPPSMPPNWDSPPPPVAPPPPSMPPGWNAPMPAPAPATSTAAIANALAAMGVDFYDTSSPNSGPDISAAEAAAGGFAGVNPTGIEGGWI